MAIIRKRDIREMPQKEMVEKLREIRQEVMSERAKISSGGLPDNPGKLAELRKVIARIKTIAGERGYNIDE